MEDNKDSVEEKQVTEDWEEFVRSEISGMLDTYLPYSVNGNVGVSYKKVVVEQLESGPVYDPHKVNGVTLIIDFDFNEAMEKPE